MRLTPEQRARKNIDRQLEQCGWHVQDHKELNIATAKGVAVVEVPLKSGFADYLLYADAEAIGPVEAAGLDPDQVVGHTRRHTAITHLVQAGVDLPTVKRISGHKTLAMVERYAHANGEHTQAAMDKLQSRLQKTPVKGVT